MPEYLLRKYRPVGPRPDLCARILVPERAAWPWALAAAALLLMAVGFHTATSRLGLQEKAARTELFDADARIGYATGLLGGGEDAQRIARWIVLEEELRRSLPAVAGAPARVEGPR